MSEITKLEPKLVWELFDAITRVPRPSKKEEKIREFLVDFAKKHNIDYQTDETGNVVMRVPGTKGYENRPCVILQSHMDMVCDTRRGHESYVWYNPPGKRRMFFKNDLNIGDGMFHVPGVIYIIKNERMDIFAYKGKKPDGRTPLYLAPFFNVTGGNVCLGNSTLEKPESLDFHTLLEYWEKRFWLSEFSHLGGGKNPTRNNLVLVTERMREQPFDNDELQPINKRLKDILP
jgi:hypothetical protein